MTSPVLTLGKYLLIKVKAIVCLDNQTLFFQKFLYIFSLYQVDFKKKFVCYENQTAGSKMNFFAQMAMSITKQDLN